MQININEDVENKSIKKTKSYKMYQHILESLKDSSHLSIDSQTVRTEHPDIHFPESQDLNIFFRNKTFELIDSLELPDRVQGAFILNDEEGLLIGEKGCPDSFNIIIFIDDKEMEDVIEHETFLDIDCGMPSDISREFHLVSFGNTLTHEIEHALEFMENSGGLTPAQVKELNQSRDFNYDVFACMTGYGMENYGNSYDEIDKRMLEDDLLLIEVENDIFAIVEERVETNSRKKIEMLDIDLLTIYEKTPEKKKQPSTPSPSF